MQFLTGGIAREPFLVDLVKFQSRRYSPDERSMFYQFTAIALRIYILRVFLL